MPCKLLTATLLGLITTIATGALAQTGPVTPTLSNSYPTRDSLAAFYSAAPVSFAQLAEGVPDSIDILVWACHSTQLPDEARDPKVVANLRRFVERGGGLFLVSFAQSYVADLQLESVEPDRMDFFRYGYNDASRFGGYFVIGIKGDAAHALFQGMTPSETDPGAFFLSGSTHIKLENCFWSKNQPKQGQVLGNYFRKNEKGEILDQKQVPVLNLWTLGRGRVLGYGNNLLLEDFWFNHDRDNLAKFLRNVPAFLTGNKDPRIGELGETASRLHVDAYMSPPAFPQPQPHSLNRRLPGLPYIGHWGWHAQIQYQRADRQCVDLDYYKNKMIDEPFRWGANLLEFYAPGMNRDEGFPFTWEDDDPIAKPSNGAAYWGGNWAPGWNNQTVRDLFTAAHDRDMLVQLFYHPDPVRFPRGTEKEAKTEPFQRFCRFQAREFQNPLLHGWRAAFDGVGSEWWADGQNGEYISQIWPYNPGSYRYSTALLPKTGPYFHGSWMCAFARTGGINACGFGDRWRYVFHPPLYLSYQADCRSMKPSTRQWGGWANYGGGSTPDWLVRQAHDFARDRLYLDSGIWWLGEPSATMKEQDRQFVYGVSTDPLRCAVTTTMRAVGRDGYRAKAYQTVADLPRQYTCEEPYPQDTAFIQNNYFRLLRMAGEDRGILQYDPTRLAHFHDTGRPQPALELSASFVSATALGLPSVSSAEDEIVLSIGKVDDSSAEFKQTGGYEKCAECAADTSTFPAQLCYEQWPDWPHEVEVAFSAPAGRYELEIHTLPNEYVCTMEVEMDGRPAGVYFPRAGADRKYVLSVSLDSSRNHRLRIGVQKANMSSRRSDGQPGLAHAFDAILLRRTDGESVVHHSPQPVGHQAILEEVAYKDPTGDYRQQRRYTVDSDSPLLKMEITNHAPEPTAWETRIQLPGYGEMEAFPTSIGTIWKLHQRQPSLPPLVLIDDSEIPPQQIVKDGDDVVITSPKGKTLTMNLAILIDDGLYAGDDYQAISQMLHSGDTTLSLTDSPIEYENKLDIPRVEVVRIKSPHGGPYVVAEKNRDGEAFWLVRGAQPAGEVDRLKLYLQPKSTVRIQRYGYIEGIVKPGFGCQYSLAIKDNIRPGACEVEVVKTGPFMFAPRIDWKQPLDRVKVNGRDWRYFDDSLVFLPNKPGRYVVEVENTGSLAPSLGRTFLNVESATWNAVDMTLELATTHPHWWQGPLPGNIPYTALLLARDYEPVGVEGDGSLIDWTEYEARDEDLQTMKANGAALRLNPGKLRIRFQKR